MLFAPAHSSEITKDVDPDVHTFCCFANTHFGQYRFLDLSRKCECVELRHGRWDFYFQMDATVYKRLAELVGDRKASWAARLRALAKLQNLAVRKSSAKTAYTLTNTTPHTTKDSGARLTSYACSTMEMAVSMAEVPLPEFTCANMTQYVPNAPPNINTTIAPMRTPIIQQAVAHEKLTQLPAAVSNWQHME